MVCHGWGCKRILHRWAGLVCWLALVAGLAAVAAAREPFEFTPGTHGEGSLKLIDDIPVATVRGTPDEMGQQLGSLLAGPLGDIAAQQDAIVAGFGFGGAGPVLGTLSDLLAGQIPADGLAELKAVAGSSGVSAKFLVLGNVIYDIAKIGGCSALMADAGHSATGQTLLGRNMDFPSFGFLDRVGMVVVYRGAGKHALASITFPGFLGCISGINDAGLAVAQLEVTRAGDGSSRIDPLGTPLGFCFRQVLEECATVEEAQKLLGKMHRTSMCNMAICDTQTVAVLEITTKSVVRRPAESGFCACTNHFRSPGLGPAEACRRYEALAGAFGDSKLTLVDLAHKLDQVHQGKLTIQTMIFEPASLRLHLAMGPGPVSHKPLELIELAPLLKDAK